MIGKFCSLNGKLIPAKEAVIPVDDIKFCYGFGVYETLKIRNRVLYFPKMHIGRLFDSAAIIELKHDFDHKGVHENLENLVKSVEESSFNVKMMMVGGNLYIFATHPLFVQRKAYRDGVHVIMVDGERQFPRAKTLNMLVSYLAHKKAKDRGAYDALLVDGDGLVREGTKTNLFYTDGKTLFTPPTHQVLDGVTRRTVIESLADKKIIVHERALQKDELEKYAGFFLTSTSSKVLPISQVDDKSIPVPALIKEVIKIYDAYLDQYGCISPHLSRSSQNLNETS